MRVIRINEDRPRDLFMNLTITDSKYRIRWGLNVGVTESDVKRVLGDPAKIVNGTFVYETETESVSFYFQDGILRKIKWEWYVD